MKDKKELYDKLKTIGIPIALGEIPINDKGEQVRAPYIIYDDQRTNNFGADNKMYHKIQLVYINLITTIKDIELEKKVENIISETYWDSEVFKELSEKLYRVRYEVRLY